MSYYSSIVRYNVALSLDQVSMLQGINIYPSWSSERYSITGEQYDRCRKIWDKNDKILESIDPSLGSSAKVCNRFMRLYYIIKRQFYRGTIRRLQKEQDLVSPLFKVVVEQNRSLVQDYKGKMSVLKERVSTIANDKVKDSLNGVMGRMDKLITVVDGDLEAALPATFNSIIQAKRDYEYLLSGVDKMEEMVRISQQLEARASKLQERPDELTPEKTFTALAELVAKTMAKRGDYSLFRSEGLTRRFTRMIEKAEKEQEEQMAASSEVLPLKSKDTLLQESFWKRCSRWCLTALGSLSRGA